MLDVSKKSGVRRSRCGRVVKERAVDRYAGLIETGVNAVETGCG